jgi:NTP pyrophosphatase (non-canonical NTP hydrolase)
MTTRLQDLAAEAVRTWGADKQLRQLTEECGELVAAVNQRERGRVGDLALAVELADVAIMLEQAKLVVGVDVFESCLEQQLKRLEFALQYERVAKEWVLP